MSTYWDEGGHDKSAPDGFSQPTYHHTHDQDQSAPPSADGSRGGSAGGSTGEARRTDPSQPPSGLEASTGPIPRGRPSGTGSVTVTRAVVARSRYFSKLVAHKVISASEADGAKESGLTAMIWNQVMSYGADAMVTVALAGTVFFSASSTAQKGNVLLYLLITMAPFAIVAPVIGPALDRVQHGRRWVMAATAIGRAALALVMAQNFNDLYVLFPAALGSLVLSKAYSVIRSSAAPRLVPSTLTLVEANARLSIFGLAAALVGGGIVGVAIKATGSYSFGLWITALAFGATAFYSFRLPKIVDTLPADEAGPESAPGRVPVTRVEKPGPLTVRRRFASWAVRGYSAPTVLALQGECALRWLAGFLTLYIAFFVEADSHGFDAVLSLGALGLAMGAGNFIGTGVGARLKLVRPELIVLICNSIAALACLLAVIFFSLALAIVAALLSAISNSLAKLSLDAIIQRDVPESLRSSAFGRSETFLQLSWVLGATIAILVPADNGRLAFGVATAVTGGVAVFMALHARAERGQRSQRGQRGERHTGAAPQPGARRPGNLGT